MSEEEGLLAKLRALGEPAILFGETQHQRLNRYRELVAANPSETNTHATHAKLRALGEPAILFGETQHQRLKRYREFIAVDPSKANIHATQMGETQRKPFRFLAAAPSETQQQPFRFLDLPKDIRLLVYECLPVKTRYLALDHQDPSINDKENSRVKIVVQSLPGAYILTSCRTIYHEARMILTPLLEKLSSAPPKMISPYLPFSDIETVPRPELATLLRTLYELRTCTYAAGEFMLCNKRKRAVQELFEAFWTWARFSDSQAADMKQFMIVAHRFYRFRECSRPDGPRLGISEKGLFHLQVALTYEADPYWLYRRSLDFPPHSHDVYERIHTQVLNLGEKTHEKGMGDRPGRDLFPVMDLLGAFERDLPAWCHHTGTITKEVWDKDWSDGTELWDILLHGDQK
ncbi:hypothetical protein P171DRAFT_483938 [Karstenula rhodostoma CBS 690.94]|uniref:Pre-mRNA processing factor 4 (PRP4)-like domain-containing protein n=1 Tax=Karstenula rhodostoma CBS 690.94 TaxID=1392251 RepID=A0A9P4PK76_9PLEO|nr:hypothetical protein P171DRAFT_483938 [Karstenula rhodostoma CBS 690.94]